MGRSFTVVVEIVSRLCLRDISQYTSFESFYSHSNISSEYAEDKLGNVPKRRGEDGGVAAEHTRILPPAQYFSNREESAICMNQSSQNSGTVCNSSLSNSRTRERRRDQGPTTG